MIAELTLEFVLLRIVIVLYLAATLAALAGIVLNQRVPRWLLSRCLAAGVVIHATSIVLRSVSVGHLAVTTLAEALSCLALLLVSIFLIVQHGRPLVALGAVVSPLAFGLTLAADVVYEGARPLPPALRSPLLPVHVGLSILGDAVFALAFSVSLLYLLQERRLKSRRLRGWLPNMASLEALDRLNYHCLVWGLVLLTLGIVTGIIWAHSAWAGVWSYDPKLVFSVLTWLIYVVLLQGRMTAGWRGRRAATLTIAGFAVIVISMVSVNVFSLGSHAGAF
jgi:cytochrome c-type biogenesis protein CcsB